MIKAGITYLIIIESKNCLWPLHSGDSTWGQLQGREVCNWSHIVHPERPWTNVLRLDASWGCVRPHTGSGFPCVHLRASAFVCVRLRTYMYVCVRVRASTSACEHLRPRASVCVRVHASAFVCIQTIKSPDASRRKWISASGRVFCSRTFRMYYRLHVMKAQYWARTWQR